MFVLRGVATVTTLICKDLARSDPCQERVRGIGSNLVIALLMDGPQLKDRRPARYATVLAEDPGSSVLTVTSAGLLRRSNDTRQFPASDKIGLWRDDTGRTSELSLAPSAQALCLTLQPTAIQERTLDGRADNTGSQSWRLTGMAPVIIRDPNRSIIDGQWPSRVSPQAAAGSSSSSSRARTSSSSCLGAISRATRKASGVKTVLSLSRASSLDSRKVSPYFNICSPQCAY